MIEKAYSYCIQGDVGKAIRLLRSRSSSADRKSSHFLKALERRFFANSMSHQVRGADDRFIRALVSSYRQYYRAVLIHPHKSKKAESDLLRTLQETAKQHGLELSRCRDVASCETKIIAEAKRRNYFCLLGRVLPHRSLMIWKKQSLKEYRVRIPGGVQKVQVWFLQDFVELSWLHYATFGKLHVGGWAKKDALYCVRKRYKDLNSEQFRVSYLVHEAQHFSDYRRFPKLESADLEYRAKLAEVIQSKRPRALFLKLIKSRANNRKSPHAYAAYCMARNVARAIFSSNRIPQDERWRKISGEEIRLAAGRVFDEHTTELRRRGARNTTRVI
jgi:hypothetical protein